MPKPAKKRPVLPEERNVKKTRLSSSEERKPCERQGTTRKKSLPLWSQKLSSLQKTSDDYIMGTASSLESAYDVIDCHSRSLLCDYFKSNSNHGDVCKKKKVESRILWQSKQIEFDGIPFSVSSYYHYKCSYSFKNKSKVINKDSDDQDNECRETNLVISDIKPTKYTCCPAKVTMKEIIKYSDYVMALDASKAQKKTKLKKLKEDLQNGVDMNTQSKFILSLPLECVHNHKFSGKSRNINRLVKKKIEQFVTGGIKSPKKVKDKLTTFVKDEFKGLCPPSKEDGAYYPSAKNIKSYINTCSKDKDHYDAEEKIKLDEQETEGMFCEPSTLEEAVKIFCSGDLSDDFDTTDSCDMEDTESIAEKIRQKLEAIRRITYSTTDETMLINIYNTLVILTDQFIPKNDVSNVVAIVPNGNISDMNASTVIADGSFDLSTTFNGPISIPVEPDGSPRSDLLMSSLPHNDLEGFQTESVQPVICSSSEDQIALLRQQILLDHDQT